MKQDIKDRWIAALRSGRYTQTDSYLHKVSGGYCCLGVLCEIAVNDGVVEPVRRENDYTGILYRPVGTEYTDSTIAHSNEASEHWVASDAVLPMAVIEWAGLTQEQVHIGDIILDPEHGDGDPANTTASYANDSRGLSFDQIADLAEVNL